MKNNNYNVKVREARPPPFPASIPLPSSPSSPLSLDSNESSPNIQSDDPTQAPKPDGGPRAEEHLPVASPESVTSARDSPPPSPSSPASTSLPSPVFPPPSIIANTHDTTESGLIKHFHHIIYENALDPVLVHDMDGWIVDANGAAVALTGYSIEELRHKNIRELESRYVRPDPKILEQLMSGAAFRIYGEHISKQGRVFPVEVHISLATVEGKNYVVGLFRDMTEILRAKTLEKANEVAQATNRAKNVFLATMSHELTTPLYGVMASLEILKQSILTEKQLDILDCAMNSAIILKGIVNDILDLSVLELGMFKIAKDPFSFTHRVASSFQIFGEAARFQGLSFKWLHDGLEVVHLPRSTSYPPSSSYPSYPFSSSSAFSPYPPQLRQVEFGSLPPLNVVGDPKRMQQVLMNLLSNAVKFTPRGGSVVLSTHVTSQDDKSVKLRIDVADTGIGLPVDQQQRVFEKFTQAEEGFTRKYSGTGLGLYISNKLVLLMGGKLTVKSEVRKGSVFTIDIRMPKYSDPLPPQSAGTEVIDTPPLVAAMAAYHRFGKKRHRERRRRPIIPQFPNTLAATANVGLPLTVRDETHKEDKQKHLSEPLLSDASFSQGSGGREMASDGDDSDGEDAVGGTPRSIYDETDISTPSSSAEPSPRGDEGGEASVKVGDILSVLLVEDNIVNQKVGKQLLRTLGIRDIDIANDGQHCLDMIKARRLNCNKRMYNVILMDKQMPFLDGLEATRVIRQQEMSEGHVRMVIIALTADCRAGVDQEVLSAGMDDYLTKPVQASSIYNTFLKHGLLAPP